MTQRTALTDLTYLDFRIKAGKEFDDTKLPKEIVELWEKQGHINRAEKPVTIGKEAKHGS